MGDGLAALGGMRQPSSGDIGFSAKREALLLVFAAVKLMMEGFAKPQFIEPL